MQLFELRMTFVFFGGELCTLDIQSNYAYTLYVKIKSVYLFSDKQKLCEVIQPEQELSTVEKNMRKSEKSELEIMTSSVQTNRNNHDKIVE